MTNIEAYRKLVASNLAGVPTFQSCLPKWKSIASTLTNQMASGDKVLDLGSHLKTMFDANSGAGRAGTNSQSEVAKAGVAWETLVVWYLNIVFSGTRAIATRKISSLVPDCILDAIAVTYGNFQTNSESDVLVLVLPKDSDDDCIVDGHLHERYFRENFHEIEVGIIQCKTSFADNMQVPMLWDMVYKLAATTGQLSVGRNGYSIHKLKKFTYSLATVPTQKGDRIPKASGMPVKRVRNLSGGNFWGMASVNDVALSLKEIFTRNFGAAFDLTVPASIDSARKNEIGFFSD